MITLSARHIHLPFSLDTYVISVFAPVQYLITKSVNGISSFWDHYVYLVGAEKEKEELQEKLMQLTEKHYHYLEMEERYNRLLAHLDFKQQFDFETVAAEVISHNLNSWYEIVTIDRGTQDGVIKEMAVVSHLGLVGQVIQAASDWSKVLLITDFRSSVDALIQRNRQGGIVVGSSKNTCKMKYLPLNADILPGDQVISSGLGGLYPKGLPIGRIVDVNWKDQGFFKEASVALNVDINKLEEVLVVTRKE